MRFLALATDYDGTLATDGRVPPETVEALQRLQASGRKLLLVTGRVLDDLLAVFPEAARFDSIVAENGALLYRPATGAARLLSEPVPQAFKDDLRRRGLNDVFYGQGIAATWHPHEQIVQESLRSLGLNWHVILNKDAVMVLPTGVNKASGLTAALEEMKLSPAQVVGVGDAENDLPMLELCGCGAAVGNALDSVKTRADVVLSGARGAGVQELIEALLKDDLQSRMPDDVSSK